MEDVFTARELATDNLNAINEAQRKVQSKHDNIFADVELKTTTMKELIYSDLKEPEAIVENLIHKSSSTVIGGNVGVGKTLFAIVNSLHISAGRDFLGKKTLKSKVLYIDEENYAGEIKRRVRLLKQGEYFSDEDLNNIHYSNYSGVVINTVWKTAIYDKIVETDAKVVVFDSLVRFFSGKENESMDTRQIFDFIKKISKELGTAFIILHHVRKTKGRVTINDLRGSGEIVAGASSVLLLNKESDGSITLKQEKNRFGKEDRDVLKFRIEGSDLENYLKLSFLGTTTSQKAKKLLHEVLQGEILLKLEDEGKKEFTTDWVAKNFETYSDSTRATALRNWKENPTGEVEEVTKGNYKIR